MIRCQGNSSAHCPPWQQKAWPALLPAGGRRWVVPATTAAVAVAVAERRDSPHISLQSCLLQGWLQRQKRPPWAGQTPPAARGNDAGLQYHGLHAIRTLYKRVKAVFARDARSSKPATATPCLQSSATRKKLVKCHLSRRGKDRAQQ